MYTSRSAFSDSQIAAWDAEDQQQPVPVEFAESGWSVAARAARSRRRLMHRVALGGLWLSAACSLAYGLALAAD